jgi:hypothetical protein
MWADIASRQVRLSINLDLRPVASCLDPLVMPFPFLQHKISIRLTMIARLNTHFKNGFAWADVTRQPFLAGLDRELLEFTPRGLKVFKIPDSG